MLSISLRRGARSPALSIAFAALASLPASAGFVSTTEVGTGTRQATVQIEQDDGDSYLFLVRFASDSFTSWDALLTIDAQLDSFALEFQTYSFGVFLTGITIDGDRDFGTGDLWPIPNYWQFWIDNGSEWEASMVGAQARVLTSGDADAWVFGSNAPPQPIPAPAAGIGALLMMGVSQRRRCVG
jgi:hypothetical protein